MFEGLLGGWGLNSSYFVRLDGFVLPFRLLVFAHCRRLGVILLLHDVRADESHVDKALVPEESFKHLKREEDDKLN